MFYLSIRKGDNNIIMNITQELDQSLPNHGMDDLPFLALPYTLCESAQK